MEKDKVVSIGNPLPSKKALEFLDDEIGVFFHFGIRTFNEDSRDWDRVHMELSTFNPTELDCDQWMESIKKAGAKYAVMTTKHHDGFALWPSKYTDYSVANTPWKDGKGDVVREYTDACHKHGIKVGLYYSCAQFSTDNMTNEDYNNFVCGQLEELFGGNYGEIDEIWFDNCGSDGFDFQEDRIEKLLRKLQPNALIFGGWGRDIQWVGNEWGYAYMSGSNVTEHKGQIKFAPVECDSCLTRNAPENFWFYNETHKDYTRTVDELFGMYCLSVGRGANMLINVAPDRRGLIPDDSVELLEGMGREINYRFNECKLKDAVEVRKEEDLNGKVRFTLDLKSPQTILDQIMIYEDLTNGEHIREFSVYAHAYNNGKNLHPDRVCVYKGQTVGHKHHCVFPTVRAELIDVVLDDADDDAVISKIEAFYVGDRSGRNIKK